MSCRFGKTFYFVDRLLLHSRIFNPIRDIGKIEPCVLYDLAVGKVFFVGKRDEFDRLVRKIPWLYRFARFL